jgi:autotransporter-associated beta strand protein
LTKNGSGVLTFSGTNSYTGGLNVNSGTVVGSVANAFGGNTNVITLTPDANDTKVLIGYTVGAYQAVTVTGSGAGTAVIGAVTNASIGLNTQYYGTITLGRDVSLLAGSGDRLTFSGKITGTGNVTISTPSTTGGRISWIQSTSGAANDFVGNITIGSGAQLQVGVASNTNNYAIPDAASIYFDASSSYLRISGSGGTAAESVNALISNTDGAGLIQATESAATLTIGAGNGSGTFSGVIGNNQVLNLVKAGSGTQVLSGVNTFAGTLGITGGTLEIGGAGKLGNGTYDAAITNDGTLVFSTSANQTLSGAISGNGSLTKSGNGTLTLSGSNSHSGATDITGGTLVVSSANSLGSGSYNIGANGTLSLGYSIADGSSFASILTGSGLLQATGAGSFSLSNAASFTGTLSVLGGSFNMTGFNGQVRLNGGSLANLSSYTGTLEVGTGSTIDVSTLNSSASVVLKSGGTLDFGSASESTLTTTINFQGGSLANASAFTGNIVVSGTGVNIGAGALGGGTLVVGTGTSVNFTGANSNTVNATGGLITGGSNLTGTIVATSGTFKIGASTGQVGIDTLNTGATVSVDGATLDLNDSATSANITYNSGSITNAASFTGMVTLTSGSNLTVNETIGGTIAVTSGATLSGNGTFNNVTVANGGVLSPGNSPGIQTYTGSLVLNGGSSWNVQVYSTEAVLASGDDNGQHIGGRGYDTIQITGSEMFGGGSFDLSGATSLNKITLNLMTLANWDDSTGGVATNGRLAYAPGQLDQKFVLATYAGSAILATGESITSIFAFNSSGYYMVAGGQTANNSQFSVSEFYNADTSLTELTLRVVPEPSTYGMILGGIALAAAAIRRRRQTKLNS